jgi:hypothetical protein
MITQTSDETPVALSVAVYRLLLAAYPKDFREAYSRDMLQVFRDLSLRAYERNGMLRLWAATLLDWIQSLFEEHLQKETNMSKSTFIRISGWALVLGGIGFAFLSLGWFMDQYYPLVHWDDNYGGIGYVAGLLVAPALTAIGLFGLLARYGKAIGKTGRTVVLVGTLIGLGSNVFGYVSEQLDLFGRTGDTSWNFTFLGAAGVMFCLALFGFFALPGRPLPRWNVLPILAGIGFPLLVIFGYVLQMFIRFNGWATIVLIVQLSSMIALGLILQGDAEMQEMEMAAA